MIDLRYLHSGNPSPGSDLREGTCAQDSGNPCASSGIPRPVPESSYVGSLMTEDAWAVVRMLERANASCPPEYLGCSAAFVGNCARIAPHAAGGATGDHRLGLGLKPTAVGGEERPRIWSIADIVADARFKQPGKVAARSSASASGGSYPPQQSAHASSAAPNSDLYGYSGATNNSWHYNQQQLEPRLTATGGLESTEAPVKLLNQALLQKVIDGYRCTCTEQLYSNGIYSYQCYHCSQGFSSIRRLHQHQVVEHPILR